jgi:hypothetical protein
MKPRQFALVPNPRARRAASRGFTTVNFVHAQEILRRRPQILRSPIPIIVLEDRYRAEVDPDRTAAVNQGRRAPPTGRTRVSRRRVRRTHFPRVRGAARTRAIRGAMPATRPSRLGPLRGDSGPAETPRRPPPAGRQPPKFPDRQPRCPPRGARMAQLAIIQWPVDFGAKSCPMVRRSRRTPHEIQ